MIFLFQLGSKEEAGGFKKDFGARSGRLLLIACSTIFQTPFQYFGGEGQALSHDPIQNQPRNLSP